MAFLTDTQHTNIPFEIGGSAYTDPSGTFAQDATRTAAVAVYTVLSKTAAGKWQTLTDVSAPLMTPAILQCGANGANLAGWQAVSDGEFAITVNGTAMDITALDFSEITTLEEITDTVNYAAAGRFTAIYDSKADSFKFLSPEAGAGQTITVMSAVSGGSGTDITGSGFFDGDTAGATVTAATGSPVTGIPAGILVRNLTATQVAAADVANVPVIVGGQGLVVDKNQIVLENSLALTDIVYAGDKHKSIADCLKELGIFISNAVDIDGFENS